VSAIPAVSSVDELSFLDLLYAVPIGDLAMRVSGAQLSRMTADDWSALAVVLAVIILSWIGMHKNRAITADENHSRSTGGIRFASIDFVQFAVEIAIIGVYFAMGLGLHLPGVRGPAGAPSQSWLAAYLFFIFLAYALWDGLDVVRARGNSRWFTRAWHGGAVSTVFTVASLVLYEVLFRRPALIGRGAVWLDAGMIVGLYMFRLAQDLVGNTPETG
jgi:hypothetical protein